MQKNSDDFSMQEALRLANSDAGQQLLALLRRQDGRQLQKIMDQAAAGDLEQAKSALSSILASPEMQEQLRRLGR